MEEAKRLREKLLSAYESVPDLIEDYSTSTPTPDNPFQLAPPVLNGTAPSPPGLNSTSASDAEATNTGNGPDLVQAASFMLRSPGQSGRWQEGEEDTVSLACGMEHAGHADSFAVTSPFMARVCLHVCAQSLSQYPQARAL
jgi:hypothetical protein